VAEARHRFDRAINLAREVEREGKRKEALSLLSTSYLALGNVTEAERLSNQLVSVRPALMSYALRGLARAGRGDDRGAEADLERAIAAEDLGEAQDSAWARCLLARHHLKYGELSEARELLQEALSIVPGYHFALDLEGQLDLQQGDYRLAARHFGEAFASSKQVVYLRHSAQALVRKGNAEAAEKLRAEAERILREELASGEYGHRLELAALLLDRGEAKDAREAAALAEAEWAARPSAETGYVLARARAAEADWAHADAVIETVLAGGIKDPRFFEACGEIRGQLGRPQQADICTTEAKHLNSAMTALMKEDGHESRPKHWL
jgi:tetratricopeptide (TPR) repeat protein